MVWGPRRPHTIRFAVLGFFQSLEEVRVFRFSGSTGLKIGILLVAIVACSSATQRRPAGRDARLITTEEIDVSRFSTALDVVQALRPQWLRMRGRTSFNLSESVKVYFDDVLLGTPSQLRNVPARAIRWMRFLDGNEATTRWGLDHGQGAIVLSSKDESASRH